MADPGPVCKTFGLDPVVNRYCAIDGIITVVDAAHFLMQLARERPEGAVNEPAQQVAFADKVLLNKVDAVSRDKAQETIAVIRSINAFAPVVECSLSLKPNAVPVEELVSIESFDLTRLLTVESEQGEVDLAAVPESHAAAHEHSHDHSHSHSCEDPNCTDPSHGAHHSHSHDADCSDSSHDHDTHDAHDSHDSHHDSDIGSMVLELKDAPMDIPSFNHLLDELLERSVDLYRYKGILACAQGGKVVRLVLQGVHDMLDLSFSGEWPSEKPLRTQVVLIGRKLDKTALEQRFQECALLPDVV
eukprot:s46_g46.t1